VFCGDPHREDHCKGSLVSSGRDATTKASADIQQKPDHQEREQLDELVQAPVAPGTHRTTVPAFTPVAGAGSHLS
jgi:hypothetical protein